MPESSPTNESPTSLSLLERARASDPDAWRRLVRIYGPLVFTWLRSSALEAATVADLSQEVWHAASLAMPRFRRDPHSGTFRGWLWTISRNKANDFHRSRRGQPTAAGGTDAHRFIEALPEEEPKDNTGVTENQLLQRALEQIRPDFEERSWRAFWRMTVDGQSAADVGAELGRGSMGGVFLAEHPRLGQQVALKVMGVSSRQGLVRFEAERQSLALMDHPNIARVLDSGVTEDGLSFFAMELVQGAAVTRWCDDRRLPPIRRR